MRKHIFLFLNSIFFYALVNIGQTSPLKLSPDQFKVIYRIYNQTSYDINIRLRNSQMNVHRYQEVDFKDIFIYEFNEIYTMPTLYLSFKTPLDFFWELLDFGIQKGTLIWSGYIKLAILDESRKEPKINIYEEYFTPNQNTSKGYKIEYGGSLTGKPIRQQPSHDPKDGEFDDVDTVYVRIIISESVIERFCHMICPTCSIF